MCGRRNPCTAGTHGPTESLTGIFPENGPLSRLHGVGPAETWPTRSSARKRENSRTNITMAPSNHTAQTTPSTAVLRNMLVSVAFANVSGNVHEGCHAQNRERSTSRGKIKLREVATQTQYFQVAASRRTIDVKDHAVSQTAEAQKRCISA